MIRKIVALTATAAVLLGGFSGLTSASAFPASPAPINLGLASSYAFLAAGFTISGSGTVTTNGDYGRHDPAATAAFAGTVIGTQRTNADAALALNDVRVAQATASAMPVTVTIPAGTTSIGNGEVLSPGVYGVDSALGIIGDLVLDGGGNPNAVFIFNVNGAIDVAANGSVTVTNGTQVGNVFWNVNGGLTLNAATTFRGTVLLEGGVTATTSPTNFDGRILCVGFATLVSGLSILTPAILYTKPSAPTPASVVASDTTATVSWTVPASDGGQPVAGYTVTPLGGQPQTFPANVTSGVITGLTNGTSYTFSVIATNIIGNSDAATATLMGVPSAPASVTASSGNAFANVSWSAPVNDGGSPITGYTVTSSPAGGVFTSTGATSGTVTGLINGQPYTFTVTASNASGTSVSSAVSNSITPSVGSYTVPVNLGKAEPYVLLGATLTVPPTIGLSGGNYGATSVLETDVILGSGVRGSQAENIAATVDLDAAIADLLARPRTVLVNGDIAGRTFTPGVHFAGAAIATGAATTFTVDALGDPNAIFIFNIDAALDIASDTVMVLANGAQAKNVYWNALGEINVYARANVGGVFISRGRVIISADVVARGRFFSSGYDVNLGAGAIVTPAVTAPTAPLTLLAVAGNTEATVTWTAPVTDGGSPITGYTVTSFPSGGTLVTTGALTGIVTGLVNGTSYNFTVVATNAIGTSPPSVVSNFVIPNVNVIVGVLNAQIPSVDFGSMVFSNAGAVRKNAVTVLNVTDQRGTGLGWNVTLSTSALTYAGSQGGVTIPASAASVTSTGIATRLSGDALNLAGPRGGNFGSGTLETPRVIAISDAGQGRGAYTLELGLSLLVPVGARPGAYSGSVTVTSTSGPLG